MPEPLWQFDALLAASAGRAEGRADAITGISIDTRTLAPGDLYVAIKGNRLDGHEFVAQAFAAGAAAALVSDDYAAMDGVGPLIRVADPLEALGRIACAARARSSAHVIAITGSVGKTGTKEALRQCLSVFGPTHVAERSFNNHWGVPLTLARMPAKTAFGVFEIGMNHPGEITPLTKMVRPHTALVTNVEPVHLGFFESVEQIADAKAEIFDGLEPSGTAILNRDNPHFARLRGRALSAGAGRILTFGADPAADVRLANVEPGTNGSDFNADLLGTPVKCRIGAPGLHIVQNALAVLAALQAAGVDVARGAEELAKLRAPKGRGARTVYETAQGRIMVIDESYNANPASMAAALSAMAHVPRREFPRRVVVLGDMLELGDRSKELHLGLLQPVLDAGVDLVLACGSNMVELYDVLPAAMKGAYAVDAEGLRLVLLETVRGGDVVMLKGSLGSRIGPLVDALSERLNDAQVAKD